MQTRGCATAWRRIKGARIFPAGVLRCFVEARGGMSGRSGRLGKFGDRASVVVGNVVKIER